MCKEGEADVKKRFCSVFAFSLILSLTLCACEAKPPSGGGVKTEFLPYADSVLFNGIVNGKTCLFAFDTGTGETRTFCKDATCNHMESCNTGNLIGLEKYKDTIYTGSLSNDSLYELQDGKFVETMKGVGFFIHANGNLYCVSNDRSLLVYEKGSKTPKVLLDEYPDTASKIVGHYLYSGLTNVTRVDLEAEQPEREVLLDNAFSAIDEAHIYYGTWSDYKVYRCNLDGSEPELFLDQPVTPGSLSCDEDYVYFRPYTNLDRYGENSGDVYRVSKKDPAQIEKIAELPQPLQMFYVPPDCAYLFVTPHQIVDEDAGPEAYENLETIIYAVKKDGSGWIKLELPDV